MAETKELQVKEKQEVAIPAEHMKPGLIFTPAVDIYENDNEIILLADMPGVSTDDITIDLKDGVLTLTGDVKPWENEDESDVLVEFDIGKYYRQFNLSEAIQQEKIEANFTDGVLKLTLPKVAKAVPRKITVNNA
ncbi:MAG: Hsp20/alpha crystallin family protein [Desulfamplus sp.]|nr:Hsp20/alpha crystallin family protein [Desulfamplus sp.]